MLHSPDLVSDMLLPSSAELSSVMTYPDTVTCCSHGWLSCTQMLAGSTRHGYYGGEGTCEGVLNV